MGIVKRHATEDYVDEKFESKADITTLDNYYLKSEADTLHTEILGYVDNEVASLVNSAPETLDTLGELAKAFQENQEVVEALDNAITKKADADIVLNKTEQELTDEEKTQVYTNLDMEKFINERLEWKLVGTATGTGSVSLPDTFNELIIEIKYWETCGLFNMPYASLSSEEKYYLNGFYGASTSYGYFYISVTSSEVKIFEVYFNGVNVTSECAITVYKR